MSACRSSAESTITSSIKPTIFTHFRSKWPWPLAFWPQFCVTSHKHVSTNSKFLKPFSDLERDGRTDRRGAAFNAVLH